MTESPREVVKELWIHRNCFKDGQFQPLDFQLEQFASAVLMWAAEQMSAENPAPVSPQYISGFRDAQSQMRDRIKQLASTLRAPESKESGND